MFVNFLNGVIVLNTSEFVFNFHYISQVWAARCVRCSGQ